MAKKIKKKDMVHIYQTDFGMIPVKKFQYSKKKIERCVSVPGCDDPYCCPKTFWETSKVIEKIQLTNGMWVTEKELLELAEIFSNAGFPWLRHS